MFVSSCISTNQLSSFKGKEFYLNNGSKIVVGNLEKEQGLPVENIKFNPSEEFINYPEIAQRAGIEGIVKLFVEISEKGKVENAKVVKGIGAGCDEASWKLVSDSQYIRLSKSNSNTVNERYYISILYVL